MTDLCTGREGTNAAHCWHDTGKALMSYPAQIEQACCFCGLVLHVMMARTIATGKHGKYLAGVVPNAAVHRRGPKSND